MDKTAKETHFVRERTSKDSTFEAKINHLVSFSLDELSTRKWDSTASMLSPANFLSPLQPKIAPSSDPAFPARRSKCPVELDID